MHRQKLIKNGNTKILNCPCGFLIICGSDRNFNVIWKLHKRKCNRAAGVGEITTKIVDRIEHTTPLNFVVDSLIKK